MAGPVYLPLTIENVSLQQVLDSAEISLEVVGGDIQALSGSTIQNEDLVMDLDSSGTNLDYNVLMNKPQINSETLIGDKSFEELGLVEVTNLELLGLYNGIVRS